MDYVLAGLICFILGFVTCILTKKWQQKQITDAKNTLDNIKV